jgi:hypothetical protein
LGVIFVVHGLNGFLNFIPQDFMGLTSTHVPERAVAFVAALTIAGYVFPLICAVELFAGALLLSNHFVPLALTMLAPIIVNLVLFYAVLAVFAPALVLAVATLGLDVYLAWVNRDAFRPMFTDHSQATPRVNPPHTELRTA